MKLKESNPAYKAATASLLRRMPLLISQAAIPQEADTAALLPGMISFVLDELVTELTQEQPGSERTPAGENPGKKMPAPGEQILSTASRIYNLLPLYADAVSKEEKFHLGIVISKNFENLGKNYSLLQTKEEMKSRQAFQAAPMPV